MSEKRVSSSTNERHSSDYVVEQGWERYTNEDHAIWKTLFTCQSKLVQNRACREFVSGLGALDVSADSIPRFEKISEILYTLTKWRIVAVPGLVPDDVFFNHLAKRQFPATNWIRRREQMDYLQEPDIFHDVFGHVPLLANPIFGDYLEAYGKSGRKAFTLNALPFLARLYWYTVEFGLINTKDGLRIYGSGIVSSRKETIACLKDQNPKRVAFDLKRVMRTKYKIDDLQPIYFVVKSFESLFEETCSDFTAIYEELRRQPEIEPCALIQSDILISI